MRPQAWRFSPNGMHLYVSFQHVGSSYDVARDDGWSFQGDKPYPMFPWREYMVDNADYELLRMHHFDYYNYLYDSSFGYQVSHN